ncbi:MAG: elongation factor P maturation arginine rhamnosyltransferase EarP [Rhodocyclaceae bacterium]|nr:elongation factor P maturation arginine rhamnosyltransferase EarP [Rhodocyclaceae bacterium]
MVTPDPKPTCDIFCRVIDNYGDIGVCWRLARQLCEEHGWRVRLWVDDLRVCAQLVQGEVVEGIELHAWHDASPATPPRPHERRAEFLASTLESSAPSPLAGEGQGERAAPLPASVVIEAFACELPDRYVAAMTAMARQPVWLNLEYLCVEDWGPSFHLQPSPHPRLPLLKHFFVPGIAPGTGGLLREANLSARRQRFDAAAARRTYAADTAGRWVFLFCYDNPALPWLLDAWADGDQAVHCLVAAGKANAQVSAWLGNALPPSHGARRGALHLHALPFVPQRDFDQLLWTCDLNLVRGEDSFSRALWAARPFVWQLYPQQDAAHHTKLAAFHKNYAAPEALQAFSNLWNGIAVPTPENVARSWQALDAALPALQAHAQTCLPRFEAVGKLAENLVDFCRRTGNIS